MSKIERRSFFKIAGVAGIAGAASILSDQSPALAQKQKASSQKTPSNQPDPLPGILTLLGGAGLGFKWYDMRRKRIISENENPEREAWNKRLEGIPRLDSFRISKEEVKRGR